MNENLDGQVRMHLRRGMLELDVLLTQFYEKRYASLSLDEQVCFAEILMQEDPVLLDWLMGYSEPDEADFKALVSAIRESRSLN